MLSLFARKLNFPISPWLSAADPIGISRARHGNPEQRDLRSCSYRQNDSFFTLAIKQALNQVSYEARACNHQLLSDAPAHEEADARSHVHAHIDDCA
eukprot:4738765-Pleurochrysis_carterae.AAC.1